MSERLKQILLVAAFIGATGLFAFGLYYLFFRQPTDVAVDDEPSTDTGGTTGLPQSGLGGDRGNDDDGSEDGDDSDGGGLPISDVANGGETFTTLLTTSAVTSPTTTADGTVAFYDPTDGRFYTIDEDGEIEMLTRQQFPNAESVVFADGATKAAIEFPDGSNVIYDFESASQVTLPSHWEEFSFSPDGEAVAGKSLGANANTLVVTTADGSATEVIANLGNNESKIDVSWSPDANVLGFSRTGSVQDAFGRQQIYLIGLDGEDAGAIVVEGSSFMNIWAPDGNHILYSVADTGDEYRAVLYYADTKNTIRKQLGIRTLASKCAFTSTSLAYCAVPREMPAGGGSNINNLTAPDDLYKISFPSGTATLAAIPAADTQMFNPSVSDDGATLYYTDSRGRLNAIRLK